MTLAFRNEHADFYHEDGGDIFFWNVSDDLQVYITQRDKRTIHISTEVVTSEFKRYPYCRDLK